MVPVAVSVPADAGELDLQMEFDNWAFGAFRGAPRPPGVVDEMPLPPAPSCGN
ncbi:MAG: hypothetical protein R3F20_06645 [Planctomycetota bacterium]